MQAADLGEQERDVGHGDPQRDWRAGLGGGVVVGEVACATWSGGVTVRVLN